MTNLSQANRNLAPPEKHYVHKFIKMLFLKRTFKNKQISVDPSSAAAFIAQMVLDNKKPFIKPTEIKLNENIGATIKCAILGYSLFLYLSMLQNKYGKEISKIVRENLIVILNRADNLGNGVNSLISEIEKGLISTRPYEKDYLNVHEMSDEALLAIYILINFNTSSYFIRHEDRKNRSLTFEKFISTCDDHLFTMLVNYLSQAKIDSIEVFSPLIKKMSFKKESILFLNISPEIIWSSNPGCFERYLQRVYFNPLIDNHDKEITQEQVNFAKDKDLQELGELIKKLNFLYESIPDEFSKNIKNEINDQRSLIENMIGLCYQTGGDGLKYIGRLVELREKYIECWRIFLSNNTDELEQLEKAELYYNNVVSNYDTVFGRQHLRKDSPIRKHTLELLLFEDIDPFKKFFATLSHDKEATLVLKNEILKLVKKANENNIVIPMISEKLFSVGLNDDAS